MSCDYQKDCSLELFLILSEEASDELELTPEVDLNSAPSPLEEKRSNIQEDGKWFLRKKNGLSP